jgi:hypothetical protein
MGPCSIIRNHFTKLNYTIKFMKIFVPFLISLYIPTILFGQYFHFPDSNATWSVYNEKYYLNGDSIFDARIYKKFYFTNDSLLSGGTFYALFREDTVSKQVFVIPSGSDSEKLIYDFSLSINDITTVHPVSFPYYSGPINISISQIDSILIDGNYRKRFFIEGVDQDSNLPEYWIEGIGSTFGIFNSGLTGITISDIYYPTLLCFEQEGNLLFQNADFIDCYEPYPIGINENELFDHINVFPNPTHSKISIRSDELIINCKVFSSYGKFMEMRNINSSEHSLDMSDYQSGMYFLLFETLNGISVKKVFKRG